jgi:acyl-coenzyme A synthetase/AMP-(fatty) acid ligase
MRGECHTESKIADSLQQSAIRNPKPAIGWHRMGDVGYLDDHGRFWYCGRKSQRVETANGPLYTECVEAIVNTHRRVQRSALVGVGTQGRQTPVIIIEHQARWQIEDLELLSQLNAEHAMLRTIHHLYKHPSLPVDVRHNSKINREQLAAWAAKKLRSTFPQPPAPNP